jgi:outer membrane protein OmpA-like peptidoglycan-associated protein
VRDASTKKPLGSHIELVDNATQQTVYSVEGDPQTGEYLLALPEGSRYGLTVSATGYLFQSRFFDFKDAAATGEVQQDFYLDPLKLGAKTVLNNVFFASASDVVLPESQPEIERVASLMKQNSSLKVEIGGHTDSVGTDEANVALSKRRAQHVREFLIKAGVADQRLLYQGYGESKPAAPNKTDAGRAMNRRIEFTILAL